MNHELLHLYEPSRLQFYSALQKFEMIRTINAYNADLEKLVEERTDDLEKVLESKNKLLNVLSQNLRNPLSSVMMTMDVLDPEKFSTTPEIRETYRQRSVDSIQEILDIIDNILQNSDASG